MVISSDQKSVHYWVSHSPTTFSMAADSSLPECPWQQNKYNAKDKEACMSCIGNVFSKSGSLKIFLHRGNHLLSGQWVGIPSMASVWVCPFYVATQVRASNLNSPQITSGLNARPIFLLLSSKPFRLGWKKYESINNPGKRDKTKT